MTRRADDAQRKQALKLLAQGMNGRQVADALGIPYTTWTGRKERWGETLRISPEERGRRQAARRLGNDPSTREALARMLRDGMTGEEIAQALGVKPITVATWKRRWGMVKPHDLQRVERVGKDPETRAKIERMAQAGANNEQIGAVFGLRARTVGHWRRQWGHPTRNDNPLAQPDAKQRMEAMIAQGMKNPDMADAFGVKLSTFRWWKDRFGLAEPKPARKSA